MSRRSSGLTFAILVTMRGHSLLAQTPVTTPAAAAPDTLWHAERPPPVPIWRDLEGTPDQPGPFHFYYQAPARASLSAHRHTAAMHIRIRVGHKYLLMGPTLDSLRLQRFDAGSTFVIPAGVWHVEWWDTLTLEEIDGVGPLRTEWAPGTPAGQP